MDLVIVHDPEYPNPSKAELFAATLFKTPVVFRVELTQPMKDEAKRQGIPLTKKGVVCCAVSSAHGNDEGVGTLIFSGRELDKNDQGVLVPGKDVHGRCTYPANLSSGDVVGELHIA